MRKYNSRSIMKENRRPVREVNGLGERDIPCSAACFVLLVDENAATPAKRERASELAACQDEFRRKSQLSFINVYYKIR